MAFGEKILKKSKSFFSPSYLHRKNLFSLPRFA